MRNKEQGLGDDRMIHEGRELCCLNVMHLNIIYSEVYHPEEEHEVVEADAGYWFSNLTTIDERRIHNSCPIAKTEG